MKNALIQVLIKRFGPSALRAGVLYAAGLITVYSGVLGPLGITYDKVAGVITIHLNTLIIGVTAILTMVGAGTIKVTQETVTPKKEDSAPKS